MALPSHSVDSDSLENWKYLSSGGFGHVYKARHKKWGFDVAVKLLKDGVGGRLCQEVTHMEKVSCEFVLRVYGIYEGPAPHRGPDPKRGMVMEFMSQGSVQDLQEHLGGPPPWPLVARLAHQVALGMNFLHSMELIHQDLKPSNVLLNDDLNAKLADFGLSRVSTSALINNNNKTTTEGVGGTYKYMPPEAFQASYEPVRSFDRYSYGVLLWSIVSGKEPYPMACSSRVMLRIPAGDRPSCGNFDLTEAEGVKELVDLMKMCWDQDPDKRPTFKDCLNVTEEVFSKYRKEVHAAVHLVLTTLDSLSRSQQPYTNGPSHSPPQIKEQSHVDHARVTKTEKASSQESGSDLNMSNADKAKFIVDNWASLVQDVTEVMTMVDELGDMVHSEAYASIEAKPTSQMKMRALLRSTLRSGGVRVYAAFYAAIARHRPELVQRYRR